MTQTDSSQIDHNNDGVNTERVIERVVYVEKPVQVELTPKKYKTWILRGRGIQAIGKLIMLGGVLIPLFFGKNMTAEGVLALIINSLGFGVIFIFVGICIQVVAQQRAWWNHG